MSGDVARAPLGLLLVEDSPTDSRLLMESIRDAVNSGEVAVQTVRRLSDALRELRRFSFSCVLVDLGLPDGEGVGQVRRIREADPRVAIVVLTGLEDPHTAAEARALGAQDYVVKGQYWGGELLKVVRRAVSRSVGAETASELQNEAFAVQESGFQPWVDLDRRQFCAVQAQLPELQAQRFFAEALQQWRSLRAALGSGARLSIAAVGGFETAIADARVDPRELRLSVAAGAVIDDMLLRESLTRLRREGASIDLSGWRPGAAPLEALSVLPLDGLLIDEVVAGDTTDPGQGFVRASLAAAGAFGLLVLAQGVALAHQHARLAALGCRYLSGPWFCPAQSAADLPGRWRKGPWVFDR